MGLIDDVPHGKLSEAYIKNLVKEYNSKNEGFSIQ